MAVLGRRRIASFMRKRGSHILRLGLSCLEHALIKFGRGEGGASSLELWARIEIGKLNASKRKGRGCELLECVKGRRKRSNRRSANL
jgi:hypothetical protein